MNDIITHVIDNNIAMVCLVTLKMQQLDSTLYTNVDHINKREPGFYQFRGIFHKQNVSEQQL